MTNYLLDKETRQAEARLSIKERLQDPATIEYLQAIGVSEGWHCLEIGGGRGSIAGWLCQKVGRIGNVTVIDQDIRFLESCARDNLEVIEADVSQYDLGMEKYDLIHARDVLVHIDQRETLLAKMTTALKYGGWILLEEPDVITDTANPSSPANMRALYEKVTGSIYRFLQESGLDPYFGRSLFGILHSSGFASLQAQGRVHMFQGGAGQIQSPHMMAFEQLREIITSETAVTDSEYISFLQLAKNPAFAWREGLTMSVWGQRKKSA